MDYMRQLNAFWNWRLLNQINSKTADLYFALLHYNNLAGWVEWFTAANQTLQALCSMDKAGLHRHRNELIQMDRIEYRKGKKGQAGSYRIVPFQIGSNIGCYNATNRVTNTTTNMTTNTDTNPATNMTDIIKHKHKQDKKIYIPEIVDYLNAKAEKNFKPSSAKTISTINARLNEGFTVEQFKQVIDIKTAQWKGTEFENYLRPETLFGNKFEGYLNQKAGVALNQQNPGKKAPQADNFKQRNYSQDFYDKLKKSSFA